MKMKYFSWGFPKSPDFDFVSTRNQICGIRKQEYKNEHYNHNISIIFLGRGREGLLNSSCNAHFSSILLLQREFFKYDFLSYLSLQFLLLMYLGIWYYSVLLFERISKIPYITQM